MPVVLVHGVPDTHRVWEPVRDHLERSDIIALSLPGFDNTRPNGFSSSKEAYVDWIIAELAKLDGPADLVGHDWGCILTARVASLRPELVRSWAGISGPVDVEYEWHDYAKIWQTYRKGEQWMAELDIDAFARDLVAAGMPADEAAKAMPFIDAEMKASILALYRSAVHLGSDWEPALSGVTSPSLVIWGLDDPFLPHRFADLLGQKTRARAVVKLRSSHFVPLEQPSEVARELEAHWATVQ
ncbi:alpha/beta fold hydrolase [Beijerinckia sp. L45]|uniref:alpha/beta fold hydrolase n=1 Tax=Beijerinckia sp. L45 TaxID=1641855 RepID=UPI00131D6B59|nr:alpha/beta hydrolase [Beijerinckia sp. L45]